MNISELSLRRPVLATVMNLMIILFGIVGYNFLAVRDYPAIDPPIITVTTSYTGANPDIIESQITEPLEKQVNGIPGIRTISSTSSLGEVPSSWNSTWAMIWKVRPAMCGIR